MAIDGLNADLLSNAAHTGEPIRLERPPYMIEIFVRRMESYELEQIRLEREAEAAEATQHPLSYPSRMDRRVPTPK